MSFHQSVLNNLEAYELRKIKTSSGVRVNAEVHS